MYNYQQHQRQQKVATYFHQTYQQFLNENKYRKTLTQSMNKNHKKRVDAFMLSAIDDPIKINQYKHPKYDPRAFLSAAKLVRSFRMNYHNTQQRLQQILDKNSYLDGVPFKNTSIHKFREPSQMIHKKPFKFMADSTVSDFRYSRLSTKTAQEHQDQMQNRKREIFKHYSNLYKIKDKSPNFQPNKATVQTRRAYFNSLKTLLVQSPNNNMREHPENDKQSSDKYDFENDRETKRNFKIRVKPNEEINRKTKAIQALTKCGFLKPLENNSSRKNSIR